MRRMGSIWALGAWVAIGCGGGSGGASTTGGGATTGGEIAAVPAGYHAVTPLLVVTDVRAAMDHYERALGATQTELIAGLDGIVVHGEIRIGDSIVMLGREDAARGQRAPTSVGGTVGGLFVYVEDVDAAVARAVAAGATQVMAPTDMFWGDRYAQIRDPEGHAWSLATHRFDLDPAEIRRRGEAFGSAMSSGGAPPTFEDGPAATHWQPQGYATVTPSLVVPGPEAIDFYVRALGAGERERMTTPDGRLMHAEITVGDSVIMLGSEFREMEPHMRTPASLGAVTMTLYHYVPDADAAFARAVGAGATAAMPVSDQPWGDRFGLVVDPSGHAWGLATHVRDVPPEELEAAASSTPL